MYRIRSIYDLLLLFGGSIVIALIGFSVVYLLRMKRSKTDLTISEKLSENKCITKKAVYISYSQDSKSILPTVKYDTISYESNNSANLDIPPRYVTEYTLPLDTFWELDRDDLRLQEPLGEGAFGLVVKAILSNSRFKNSVVAVKMLKDCYSENEMTDLISEMEVMKKIGRHTNIINMIGCCTQNGK